VANPKTGLSPKRKKMVTWSYVIAAWTTVWMAILLFTSAFVADDAIEEELLGHALTLLVLVPSIAGFSLSLGARDRRRKVSVPMLVSIIWNGLILFGFLALCLIGLFA
jgi:hypothetical protein